MYQAIFLKKLLKYINIISVKAILYKMCRFVLYTVSQTKRYCDHDFFLN